MLRRLHVQTAKRKWLRRVDQNDKMPATRVEAIY